MRIVRPVTGAGRAYVYFFIESDDGKKWCVSYDQVVACIDADGNYIEFEGHLYNSVSSKKHKTIFRRHYGVEK